mmetsp:Transcript_11264/g.33849  ORF Transcript_11264/g.33849 Transcript_11264/m.33849 type:complete len:188 (-) Transcript_11264:187-750(-)|eukprot:CAMPEP_0206141252 /NCGR_PEP_ID=MMETSP1473-20131121/12268_1 /ASSEMBLY_ACC=CAM_ASM_001109 /TAXON_ID=1461547 /ORGANISM="Stichococcus sp, Strain RCC1054" /LENGTH=187 /DNA_ID=CAMNT_0053535739 /DNA_START=245 /DNA_END=808 /DNA_ORIENTATION=+
MGGSLRRSKKYRPKLTIRKKRTALTRGKTPIEITQGKAAVAEKLGKQPEWSQLKNFADNYETAGLLSDANAGFGRNLKTDALQSVVADAEEREATGAVAELDEDFDAACSKQRPSGPAPPQRLTAHQRAIVSRLLDAHGDDVEAMVRDRKLNSMLLPGSKLQRMIMAYRMYSDKGGVDFRVPTKRLW